MSESPIKIIRAKCYTEYALQTYLKRSWFGKIQIETQENDDSRRRYHGKERTTQRKGIPHGARERMQMKIKKEIFSCQRGPLKIRGQVFTPEDSGPFPAVIVSHGFMANQGSVRQYAEALAQEGFAAFIFDFCGGCIRGQSDGATEDMTVLTEVEDLKAVIAWALSRPFVRGDKLILMGCSQGGFVSAITAAQMGEQVERLVLFYPALCIPDNARAGKMMFYRFDPANIPDILGKRPITLGGDYARTVIEKDPYEMIGDYSGPVLIVHGTEDKIVKLSYSEKAQKRYGEERCQLVKIPGAGHGFRKTKDQTAIAFLREFVKGREELFAVDVRLTGGSVRRKESAWEITLPFEGTAQGKYFCGAIEPGAADIQRHSLRDRHFVADYYLTGTDAEGSVCRIHIVNEYRGAGWTPTVTTDSEGLAFLNKEACSEYFEPRRGGPVIHIFNRPPKTEQSK